MQPAISVTVRCHGYVTRTLFILGQLSFAGMDIHCNGGGTAFCLLPGLIMMFQCENQSGVLHKTESEQSGDVG